MLRLGTAFMSGAQPAILPEDSAYADQYLSSVLANSNRFSVPIANSPVQETLPLNFVVFQGAATLFVATLLAGGTASNLDCVCWPAQLQTSCAPTDPVHAIGFGLLGAAAVRGTEVWRTEGDPAISNYDRERNVAHAVLLGTAPLALASRASAGDSTVGERAVSLVLETPSPLPAAFLSVWGVTAGCAWAQGVVQQTATLGLTRLAIANAVRTLPDDPEAVWWWPIVASASALAPFVAALLAATLTTAADIAVGRSLRPAALAAAQASEQAVVTALERSPQRFALDAAPQVARRRLRAFELAAAAWREATLERESRARAAAAARSLVAAMLYAASGGDQLAPLLAGALGGSSSVRAVLTGSDSQTGKK